MMHRKIICSVVLVCLQGFGVTAQAQLFAPPLDNPSFESPDLGAGGTGQWADYVDNWVINAQGNCYLEDGTWEIAAPDGVATLKMWNGAAIWQQIGTWSPNTEYEISLFVGRGLNTSDIQVELWAGGSPAMIPGSGFGTLSAVGATLIGGAPLVPTVAVGENEWMSLILNTGVGFSFGDALWLRIESTGEGVWVDNVQVVSVIDPALAYHPNPASESADALRDCIASWTPGLYAQTHDVYFGTNLETITSASRANPQEVLVISGQDATSYDFGRLEFGQTYYWRVDEVNGTPDKTVYKGDIWSFEVEPYAVRLSSDMIMATASSSAGMNTPDMTVNGSGLEGGTHSEDSDTMWLSAAVDLDPWLMYEFDEIQKLDHMLIWNSNSKSEVFVGWGIKEVNIEVSVDGVAWTPLAQSSQISQAPGLDTYDAPEVIDLGLALARYVRVSILSNWGGLLKQYGVAEVQFYAIPVRARQPKPESDAPDVLPNAVLTWRAGREAAQHTLYLDTDPNAVTEGTVLPVTSMTNSLDLASLDLKLGQIYYWRVDEVNQTEVVTTWPGGVWNFSTQDYLVVDDFESYNSIPVDQAGSHRVYMTWSDGYAADPSTNGSTMGYLTGTFLDSNDVHGGNNSVPLFYDNTTASLSEVTANTRDLPIGSDWSVGSPQALSLWLRGDPGNAVTDQLYIKVDNSKVTYEGDISLAQWRPWSIDLSALNVNLSHVSTLTIGLERVGGSGGTGVVLLDDITLYGTAPALVRQPDPADNLTLNPSFESPDLGPGGTGQWADHVDDWIIDAQGSAYLEDGTWQIVAPDGAAALKIWNGGAIWQQIGTVTPDTDYEISLFVGRGYDTSAVQVELWAGGNPAAVPDAFGVLVDTVGATLIDGASLTPAIAVGQSELMGLSINTGSDFGPQDPLWIRIQSTGGDGTAVWVDNVMVAKP
ncbi:MAG: discoidin domain-containing protein [Phycisphaerae bacterium]|nr:discoidin domain-containing protein [Phycisphaerae bacterium]